MRALRRILYVEDEPDIRTIVTMALSVVGGFEVCSCTSGTQALIEGPGFEPDLLLLDVMMPVMDGVETLAAARRDPALADVPVVFMTAKAGQGDVESYERLGALGVIPKPFQPMELAKQVLEMWDGRHGP